MTEEMFRIKHSEVIEWYQYIEMHLKGICSMLYPRMGSSWFGRLDDVATDSIWKMMKLIREYQKNNYDQLLSEEELARLDEVRQERNYWCHQCFSDVDHVIFKHKSLRDDKYEKRIDHDLEEAKAWNERLVEVFRKAKQKNMIAYCGVDCAACPDLYAGKCLGCRQTEWTAGDECMPVACCRKKGISVCGECESFPCADMAEFYQESESHRAALARMRALRGEA